MSPSPLLLKKQWRISKKFSFSLIAVLLIVSSLILISKLGFSEKVTLYSIVSTHLSILLVTITYLTGQAKIDLNANTNIGNALDEAKKVVGL